MDILQMADFGFSVILAITILIVLYAMAMMSRELRLLQYQVSMIETEIKLIGEEINTLAGKDFPNQGRGEKDPGRAPAEQE